MVAGSTPVAGSAVSETLTNSNNLATELATKKVAMVAGRSYRKEGRMGYFVWKRGNRWRLVWRDKEGDQHIPLAEYGPLGFNRDMTLSEARRAAKAINAASRMRRAEKSRQRAIKSKLEASTKLAQLHGQAAIDSFEAKMRELYGEEPQWPRYKGQWNSAMEWLLAVSNPRQPLQYYRYWREKPWSLDHGTRVLAWVNLFLDHIGLPRVPLPKGHQRQSIRDAWLDAGRSTESKPLTVEILAHNRAKLEEPEYNWLFITLWLGLRPNEVKSKWVMEGPHLAVFQTKLKSLPREQRWKHIRIAEPEQEKAVQLLQAGDWKRPGRKKLFNVFGRGYGEYMGRKGFFELMRSRGHSLEAISSWMGHTAPELTARKYRMKNKRY